MKPTDEKLALAAKKQREKDAARQNDLTAAVHKERANWDAAQASHAKSEVAVAKAYNGLTRAKAALRAHFAEVAERGEG